MPVRREQKRSISTTDDVSVCAWCPPRSAAEQFRAHLHWLRDFHDDDGLRVHLIDTLSPSPHGHEFRDGQMESILSWRRGVIGDFTRAMDEHGTRVHAWEAWAMAQAVPPCYAVHDLHTRLATAGLAHQEVSP